MFPSENKKKHARYRASPDAPPESASVAGSHKGWFDPLPLATRQRIIEGDIPVVLVIGDTGVGKSTAINRMTSPISQERAKVMNEVDGAAAGTATTNAQLLNWLGDEDCPIVFVDMPGLDQRERENSSIIRDLYDFLMSAPFRVVHQIVLVINGHKPRFNYPLQEAIRVLREVFDPDGKRGLVEYLSVMFTKIEFPDWSAEEEDVFRERFEDKKRKLVSWALTTEGLGREGVLDLTHEEADSLRTRVLLVNNTIPQKMLRRLEREYGLDPALGLGGIYDRAQHRRSNQFALSATNDKATTRDG